MMLTKDRIISKLGKERDAERFILSMKPVLYLPLYKLDGSAQFTSKDAHGHLCTVTGATWRPDGRYFDGSDDIITTNLTSQLGASMFDGGGSLIILVNPSTGQESGRGRMLTKYDASSNGWSFDIDTEAGGLLKMSFFHYTTLNSVNRVTSSAVVPINQLSMLALTYDSDDVVNNIPLLYLNGVSQATAWSGVSPTGTRKSDVTATLAIGNNIATTNTVKGTIKAGWAYRKLLTAREVMNHYVATRM